MFNYFVHCSLVEFMYHPVTEPQMRAARMCESWNYTIYEKLKSSAELDLNLYFGICALVDFWHIEGSKFWASPKVKSAKVQVDQDGPENVLKAFCEYIWKPKDAKKRRNSSTVEPEANRTMGRIKSNRQRITMVTQLFRIIDIVLGAKKELQAAI